MPSLKEVKNKIVGVKKTAQITKAMNMVASAKLRGAQEDGSISSIHLQVQRGYVESVRRFKYR